MLDGNVATITGGGSGIGRAAALRLARAGAAVLVGDINAQSAEETAAAIIAAGGKAASMVVDVRHKAEVDAFTQAALDRFGRLDIGVNNAGVAGGASFAEMTEESFDTTIGVNLKGVFLCMQAQLRHFAGSGGGVIVNTASVLGLIGTAGSASYVAAKHGVVGLTKCAAIEYSARNIRINSVCPGVIHTPLMDRQDMPQETIDRLVALHPIGRVGQPEEVAEAILYLASPNSSFMTGSCLVIDGGWSAW